MSYGPKSARGIYKGKKFYTFYDSNADDWIFYPKSFQDFLDKKPGVVGRIVREIKKKLK
ncbi:MAG: hypothetical protein NZZ41_04025 [Candidatus Dojkabacteria bacterium]|nr:hypothetical protein [Candidatus Dojkabacteria bacterium]